MGFFLNSQKWVQLTTTPTKRSLAFKTYRPVSILHQMSSSKSIRTNLDVLYTQLPREEPNPFSDVPTENFKECASSKARMNNSAL